jgi:predicted patatin/cPLA2 family phospholipase
MFFDGNVKVLEALREKRSLLQQNISHSHIRPLLIVCGGVMKGVYGGGAVSALETSGYGEVFDVVVGLSTGAPTVAYFLAGQSELGTRIYSEECCTKNFINPMRITRMCNTQYLVSVFKSPDKKLNTSKLLSSRTKLYIGVTEPKTAEQHFFSPETEEDLFSLVEASISMPGACPDPVHYRGKKWVERMMIRHLFGNNYFVKLSCVHA